MESNKEFIARMVLFINELPEEKRRDYHTLLSFLDVQLTLRDNLFITELVSKLEKHLMNKVNWYGRAREKKQVREEITSFCETSKHSFKVHDDNKEEVQQVLGSKRDG